LFVDVSVVEYGKRSIGEEAMGSDPLDRIERFVVCFAENAGPTV